MPFDLQKKWNVYFNDVWLGTVHATNESEARVVAERVHCALIGISVRPARL